MLKEFGTLIGADYFLKPWNAPKTASKVRLTSRIHVTQKLPYKFRKNLILQPVGTDTTILWNCKLDGCQT
eukprot:scaffold204022_cov14-Tisochrysis_lutea.AAC.1